MVGVWPLTRFFGFGLREGNYTTLLMSTGLTFGSISALFGLNNDYITQGQYSILVTVVIGMPVVPTMIAQTWFKPEIEPAVEFTVDQMPIPVSRVQGAIAPSPTIRVLAPRSHKMTHRLLFRKTLVIGAMGRSNVLKRLIGNWGNTAHNLARPLRLVQFFWSNERGMSCSTKS